jgi:hypothetical protein
VPIEPLDCAAVNAATFRKWIRERGGIAVWRSIDLGNLGTTSTPARTEAGDPTPPPGWRFAKTPERIVINESDVNVFTSKLVKSIRIGLSRGSGLSIVLSEASSRRLREAVAKAGDRAFYEFGYNDKDQRVANIFVPDREVPLIDYFCAECASEPAVGGHEGRCAKCWTEKAVG